jgi:hypothetical protein
MVSRTGCTVTGIPAPGMARGGGLDARSPRRADTCRCPSRCGRRGRFSRYPVSAVSKLPRSANACAADDNRVGLTQGAGANVLVRAESRPAGLKAQQAQKPAVGAGDSGPPTPCCGHRAAQFGKAGPRRHCAARESSQRRSGGIKSLAPGDVITFHDRLQVPGRANDQRGVDMIVAEKVPYLTDGGGQRMCCGSREHQLGCGAQDLIHRSRIRTCVRTGHPLSPPFGVVYGVLTGPCLLWQRVPGSEPGAGAVRRSARRR